MSHRLIRVPSGIGDSIWLFMKLINANETFDFHISDSKPQRAKQVFDLLPSISNSCSYVPGLAYKSIRAASEQFDTVNWFSIKEKAIALSCNFHLEQGRRIEDFLPDLPTSYILPYDTSGSLFDRTDLPQGFTEFIGVYASAYGGNKNWSGWNENSWFDLIQKIHLEKPNACFCIIGASWDMDLGGKLIRLLQQNNVPYFDTIGKPLTYVIELLKVLDYFIGYPSGLSILNETLGAKGTFMFYPNNGSLDKMMYAWADPKRIDNHQYVPCIFDTPQSAFEMLVSETSLLTETWNKQNL